MKTYNEMVREAHEILARYAESLGIYRKSDLVSEKVKSTGIKYFGGISIVRGYTRVGESGLVGVWCGRFGCGFYVDSTKSSMYSWRSYYLFTKPLSAFFSWAMSREMALAVVNLARERGYVLVDIDSFHHSIVRIPPYLTASSRNDLADARFILRSDYAAFEADHWRHFDRANLAYSPFDATFSLIDKVSFDDIRFRASIPLVPPKADF